MSEFRQAFAIDRQYPDCPGCGRDLAGLDKAIFCPGCGRQLQFRITAPQRIVQAALILLNNITFGRFGHGTHEAHLAMHTDLAPIVIGYGKAMFKLGDRYERGQGGSRNVPEAIRCYRKSARLGNPDATVRLAAGDSAKPIRVASIES